MSPNSRGEVQYASDRIDVTVDRAGRDPCLAPNFLKGRERVVVHALQGQIADEWHDIVESNGRAVERPKMSVLEQKLPRRVAKCHNGSFTMHRHSPNFLDPARKDALRFREICRCSARMDESASDPLLDVPDVSSLAKTG
jgi:hypothetical protein